MKKICDKHLANVRHEKYRVGNGELTAFLNDMTFLRAIAKKEWKERQWLIMLNEIMFEAAIIIVLLTVLFGSYNFNFKAVPFHAYGVLAFSYGISYGIRKMAEYVNMLEDV